MWSRGGTSFFRIWMDSQLSHQHLLKKLSFLTELVWHSCQNQLTINGKGLFLNSQFYSSELCVYLFVSTTHLDHWTLLVTFWNLEVSILQYCTSSFRLFWLFWVSYISIWIWGWTCQLVQNKKKKSQLEFWWGLSWISRFIWGVLPS